MSGGNTLVPITRPLLKEFYKKHPAPELAPSFQSRSQQVAALVEQRGKQAERTEPPRRSDENIWKNREQCELVSERLKKAFPKEADSADVKTVSENMSQAFDVFKHFQTTTVAEIERLVSVYMPNDFRMSMVKYGRERSEKTMQAEVDDYMAKGGDIEGKYKLLLANQMKRRESLVAMANATGIWRSLISFLGGVPPVLLDFLKSINDPEGPMEEYRLAYGPTLYSITRLGIDLKILTNALADLATADDAAALKVISEASIAYRESASILTLFLLEVLRKSPFFVTDSSLLTNGDKPREVTVENRNSFQVPIQVLRGDTVSWSFETKEADIGFGVNFAAGGVSNTPPKEVIASKRISSHLEKQTGTFLASSDGTITLVWDNTFSFFKSKVLLYRAELTVAEPAAAATAPLNPPTPAETPSS
jgi:hypothetical protein